MSDQVALVTGASRGIGKAILHALGAQGNTVIGTATSSTGANIIQEELNMAGYQGKALVLNVTQDESIKSCLLYTSPSPRDQRGSRMPSSA